MKITKQRLKEIIKEELTAVREGDFAGHAENDGAASSESNTSQVRLQQIANELIPDPAKAQLFTAAIRRAITEASSGFVVQDVALGFIVAAMEEHLLDPSAGDTASPDDDVEYADDSEALVLPDRGRAGVEKSLQDLQRQKNNAEHRRRLK